MSDGPEWFAPKRYGYGSGPPISWQGWVVTLVFVAAAAGAGFLLHDHPEQMIAAFVPLTGITEV